MSLVVLVFFGFSVGFDSILHVTTASHAEFSMCLPASSRHPEKKHLNVTPSSVCL